MKKILNVNLCLLRLKIRTLYTPKTCQKWQRISSINSSEKILLKESKLVKHYYILSLMSKRIDRKTDILNVVFHYFFYIIHIIKAVVFALDDIFRKKNVEDGI